MNDLTRSYYEIAQEEFNKSKGGNAGKMAMPQENADPTREAIKQLMMVLQEQGVEYGSPEFDAMFKDAIGQGDDKDDVERERAGVEGTKQGEKDPARNKQDREEDEEDDEEMMDKEQRIQSKMTRYK